MIETKRLKIYPISKKEMMKVIDEERNMELKKAYCEMLDCCLKHPKEEIWYTLWFMELKNSKNEIVGNLSFKGIDSDGVVEIGYKTESGYENNGYMTEAVRALVKWASLQPRVNKIEAEAEEKNGASIRVLEKCNFVFNGEFGKEGIRFVYKERK